MAWSLVASLGSSVSCLLENADGQAGRRRVTRKRQELDRRGFRNSRRVGRLQESVVWLQEENYAVVGRWFRKLWADCGLTNF